MLKFGSKNYVLYSLRGEITTDLTKTVKTDHWGYWLTHKSKYTQLIYNDGVTPNDVNNLHVTFANQSGLNQCACGHLFSLPPTVPSLFVLFWQHTHTPTYCFCTHLCNVHINTRLPNRGQQVVNWSVIMSTNALEYSCGHAQVVNIS